MIFKGTKQALKGIISAVTPQLVSGGRTLKTTESNNSYLFTFLLTLILLLIPILYYMYWKFQSEEKRKRRDILLMVDQRLKRFE